MLPAGRRMAFHPAGRGVIKHGTLRPATDGAVFFVFDVYASDWAAVLAKLVKWLGLIGCFGHAAYTTAKWASALPLPAQLGGAETVSGHEDWPDSRGHVGFCW
jgi:hypothetical protein